VARAVSAPREMAIESELPCAALGRRSTSTTRCAQQVCGDVPYRGGVRRYLGQVPEGAYLLLFSHTVSRRRCGGWPAQRRLQPFDGHLPLVTKVHLEAIRCREGYTILLMVTKPR